MIEYQNITNELHLSTIEITQNCGSIKVQIKIDNYNSNCRYFLEFSCPKGRRFVSAELNFVENVGEVLLPNIISEYLGRVFVQLVIRNNDGSIVNKSLISNNPIFHINKSINAEQDISNDKTNDVIEFLFQSINELKEIGQLLKKVALHLHLQVCWHTCGHTLPVQLAPHLQSTCKAFATF